MSVTKNICEESSLNRVALTALRVIGCPVAEIIAGGIFLGDIYKIVIITE